MSDAGQSVSCSLGKSYPFSKETAIMHTILEHRREGRGQRGFTLVELLVVVLILGVLAAVVVFSVGGITKRGNNASCETEVREVRTAIEAYKAQNNNTNPASLAILVNPANLLETAPSKAAGANPGTPSGNAGFTYSAANGTYLGAGGVDSCPAG